MITILNPTHDLMLFCTKLEVSTAEVFADVALKALMPCILANGEEVLTTYDSMEEAYAVLEDIFNAISYGDKTYILQ